MTYTEYKELLTAAWESFEKTLISGGLSEQEVSKFIRILDQKDGYNEVDDALSEAIVWEEDE